jgi:surface carbohydrate biosynthesis protein (TIGR04326 family)
MMGSQSLAALLSYYLLKAAVNTLPKKTLCIYLQENQDWERGLVQAWRAYEGKCIIGYPHSTIRYWDLRYFNDIRSNGDLSFPNPDLIAVNGQLAYKQLIKNGIKLDVLVEVESLRYNYLLEPRVGLNKSALSRKRIFVVTDQNPRSIRYQLDMLRESKYLIRHEFDICIKSHPLRDILDAELEGLDVTIIRSKLVDSLRLDDIVFISDATSSILEVLYNNLHMICCQNSFALSQCPLMGDNSITFVRNGAELANEVNKILDGENSIESVMDFQNFINLDKNFPKWKNLIKKYKSKEV